MTDAANAAPAEAPSQWRANLLFLSKFFRHGIRIASVWPSSRWLSRATISRIDFERAETIVELGAGTGPITQAVVNRLKPHTKFIAIERDPDFARILRQRFSHVPNIEIVHADVRELDEILNARGISTVKYFVSGLPTPSLPAEVKARMLASVNKYMPADGIFSNITEVPLWYKGWYKARFDDVDFQTVVLNMPPGGVYHCRAMKAD